MQHSIIARDREPNIKQARAQLILQEIAEALEDSVAGEHIQYRKPNFIIYLPSHGLQQKFLTQPTLRTTNFVLDLVAWSIENELALLPWIPVTASYAALFMKKKKKDPTIKKTKIKIDPLTILPLPSPKKQARGALVLKESYVENLGTSYDLRAPDFSYLVINEIKEFYTSRQRCLASCQTNVGTMATILDAFYPKLNRHGDSLCHAIHRFSYTSFGDDNEHLHKITNRLHQLVVKTTTEGHAICDLLRTAQQQCPQVVNLVAFQEMPNLLQTTAPSAFASRLEKIHDIATQTVYQQKAIITMQQIIPRKFGAFITVGNLTFHYNEKPLSSEAAIKTLAVYHSLKYITNVLGYRIIDPNYPALSDLISSINQQTMTMATLRHCFSKITANVRRVEYQFAALRSDLLQTVTNMAPSNHLGELLDALIDTIQQCCTSIKEPSRNYHTSKMQFRLTKLRTETPGLYGDRWDWMDSTEP